MFQKKWSKTVKPNYKNLLPIIQSSHRQAARSPTHTIAPIHTDSYSKTVHIVLLRAPDNSIYVHFVLDKTFLIPSRWDMLDSQIQDILNPPQTDTYLISQIQDILDSQETRHSWLSHVDNLSTHHSSDFHIQHCHSFNKPLYMMRRGQKTNPQKDRYFSCFHMSKSIRGAQNFLLLALKKHFHTPPIT